MLNIYFNMSFNFLIQATRVLDGNNFDESELKMVSDYVLILDNDILHDYFNTCTILSYDNDLQLYIEILDTLIKIYEEREEYEICKKLQDKKNESILITIEKTI